MTTWLTAIAVGFLTGGIPETLEGLSRRELEFLNLVLVVLTSILVWGITAYGLPTLFIPVLLVVLFTNTIVRIIISWVSPL